jgi:Peptidase inhibitor family I36
MSKFYRMLVILASVLACSGVGAVSAAASPVPGGGIGSAAVSKADDCPMDYICFYSKADFMGSEYRVQDPPSVKTCKSFPYYFFSAKSVVNNTSVDRIMYSEPNCANSGIATRVAAGHANHALDPAARSWR